MNYNTNRNEGESFEDYKVRRKFINNITKAKSSRSILLWPGSSKTPYDKSKHGDISQTGTQVRTLINASLDKYSSWEEITEASKELFKKGSDGDIDETEAG